MRNARELKNLQADLTLWQVTTLPITKAISERAVRLVEEHFLAHHLQLAAALIALFVITTIMAILLGTAGITLGCAPSPNTKSPRAVTHGVSLLFPHPSSHLPKEVTMSGLPGRRRAREGFADAHVRQVHL